jgi:osmotically-inducible protein OsmY
VDGTQTPSGATMVRSQLVLNQPDRELERRVVNFLAQQHFPRLRAIEVESRQGVVTIRGRVNSFHERQLCIHCCQRVAGVVGLNDRIQVAAHREAGPIRGFFDYTHGSAALATG